MVQFENKFSSKLSFIPTHEIIIVIFHNLLLLCLLCRKQLFFFLWNTDLLLNFLVILLLGYYMCHLFFFTLKFVCIIQNHLLVDIITLVINVTFRMIFTFMIILLVVIMLLLVSVVVIILMIVLIVKFMILFIIMRMLLNNWLLYFNFFLSMCQYCFNLVRQCFLNNLSYFLLLLHFSHLLLFDLILDLFLIIPYSR